MDFELKELDNGYKGTLPIFTEEDKRLIDNNFDEFIDNITNKISYRKDLAAAQYIIKKLQEQIKKKNKRLERQFKLFNKRDKQKQKLINKIEQDSNEFRKQIALDPTHNNATIGALGYGQEILKILKGEKE